MSKSKLSTKNQYMLKGKLAKQGYDWWWHSLTAINRETGEAKPFFFEYYICNPSLAEDKPILGQHPDRKNDHKKPSYLMIKAGTWGSDSVQLHKFISLNDVSISDNPIIKADGFSLNETSINGSITVTQPMPYHMCDTGSITWNLSVYKEIPFDVGYGSSKLFRSINAFEMYWHAEGMKTKYEGTITFNNETYDVIKDKSYGYADKNWGTNFTSPWVWISSNRLFSRKKNAFLDNSVFDIGGGTPKVFGIPLKRKLLTKIYYEGKSYEFNFSKFWTLCKTKFKFTEVDKTVSWYVRQETVNAIFEISLSCQKEDMLFINYESPDGYKRHNKLFNGGNGIGTLTLYEKRLGKTILIDEIEVTYAGCEYGEY